MKKTAVAAAFLSLCVMSCPVGAQAVGLDKTNVELGIGESTDIRLTGTFNRSKWKVSDGDVFSYKNGRITAVGEGTADLIVTSGGQTYKCTVTVTSDGGGQRTLSADRWDKQSYDVDVKTGSSVMIDVPCDTVEVSVQCDNPDSVGITCGLWNGETFELKIRGRSPGYANVTVRRKNGKLVKLLKVNVGNASTGDDRYQRESENYTSEVIRLVNEERERYGIAPLEADDTLCGYAQTRAEELSVKFSHTRPDGTKGLDIVKVASDTRAENIAQGMASPRAVVAAWMKSGGHRRNILNENFTSIGVGYDESTDSWVQIFIG